MPRKKKVIRVCERCGSWMEETGTGWQCPTCHLTEWIQEDGTYTSGIAKCPQCGNTSPNILICSYCSYPIDEKTRRLFEANTK